MTMSSDLLELGMASSSPIPVEAFESSGFEENKWSELEKSFNPFWKMLVANGICEDTPEERAAALEREKSLYTKINAGIEGLAREHSGPITILSDVDEAMAEMIPAKLATYNVLKPGFLLAIQAQKSKPWGNRLDVGLITSHKESRLDRELENPTYLKELNPEKMLFVLSSKDLARDDAEFARIDKLQNDQEGLQVEKNMQEVLNSVRGIVDPSVIEATALGIIPLNSWFHIKLAIIDRLAQDHPERAFLTIDDLPCADVVGANNTRVRGVWVGPEIHNDVFRHARMAAVEEREIALAA